MTYSDAKDFLFDNVLPYAIRELDAALEDTGGTVDSIDELLAVADVPQLVKTNALTPAVVGRRGQQAAMDSSVQPAILAALAWIGQELASPGVVGGAVADVTRVMRDFRAQMATDDDYVLPRGTVFAGDPAPGDGILLRRLTVDYLGQTLDGGIRETVTYEVERTSITGAGARLAEGVLYGMDGGGDLLDYRGTGTARLDDVALDLRGPGRSGGLTNPGFNPTGTPANGDAIGLTDVGGWTQSNPAGSPTVVFRTTNPWRNKSGGIAISGNSTTRRFEQALVIPQQDGGEPDAYTPIDLMTVVYWDNTWEGTVTKYWGNKSQAFAHTLFSGAGFKYLLPALDQKLYAINFSQSEPKFALQIATTSGSGEIVLQYADVQRMVRRQGLYYSGWMHTADPVELARKTWADTCDHTGEYNDVMQVMFAQAPEAYLPTSGANLISPPARLPVISVTPGNVALGTVSTGAHEVTFRVSNIGKAPLIVYVPTEGAKTNADLTDAGLAGDVVVMPGKYRDITVEVTDGGAGAFSCVVEFTSNDAVTGQVDRTVSGTAA